jgi:hypothetical protein
MADMTLINQAFASLQSATQLAKALIGLRDTAMIESKVIELREHLIEAQNSTLQALSEQSALIQRIHDLEEEIARVKAWEEEKKRYKLVNPWEGSIAFVYALKESCKETEIPHWICTKCYQDGQRTILQPNRTHGTTFLMLFCPTCKSEIHSWQKTLPHPTYVTD